MKGPFITIEGVDGAGKSSHIEGIVQKLKDAGFDVVATREPGGTPLGEKLREEILFNKMDLCTEVLLAFASRAEHLAVVIRPGVESGKAVVSDRFTDSTYAYQASGRGFPKSAVLALETLTHSDIQPDLTLLFDLPVEESLRRLGKTGKNPDKFERQDAKTFEDIRNGYLERQKLSPERIRIIDSSKSLDEVKKQVADVIDDFILSIKPSKTNQVKLKM
jgi:dTMP kinase